MQNESVILSRIRAENGAITVCNDETMSEQIKERMLDHSWAGSNAVGARKFHFNDFSDKAIMICQADLAIIKESKDISHKIPTRTRFRFLKIVINRIMYTVNRYQETVNNSIWNILCLLCKDMPKLRRGVSCTAQETEYALQKIEELEKQVAELTAREKELECQLKSLSGESNRC